MNKRLSRAMRAQWEAISHEFWLTGCYGGPVETVPFSKFRIVTNGILVDGIDFFLDNDLESAARSRGWPDGWTERVVFDLDDADTLLAVTRAFVSWMCWRWDMESEPGDLAISGHELGATIVWVSWTEERHCVAQQEWTVRALREKGHVSAEVRFFLSGDTYRDALVAAIVENRPKWEASLAECAKKRLEGVSTHWVDCDCPDRSAPCSMAPASVPQGWTWDGDIWAGPEPLEPHTVVVDGLPGVWRVGGVRNNGRERILYSLDVKGRRRHVGVDTLLFNVAAVEGSGQRQGPGR